MTERNPYGRTSYGRWNNGIMEIRGIGEIMEI